MTATAPESAAFPLRPPQQVMRLSRMGSFHQSRLSFMRILMRRMSSEGWTFDRTRFEIDDRGVGVACYTVQTATRPYTLVAFAHDLPADQRSDRVIATAWDATFALHDGIPSDDDIARLGANVPRQEAGRVGESELTLSRANRSVRLWDHTIDALAAGTQPDRELLDSVGYLMRTTAVYGSGKFGAADRQLIADRPEFTAPFQVEMLTVYLIRLFVFDLVEHLATERNPNAAKLDPELRRSLGIGNSTGLGMAPFLINHPLLINNWIEAREQGLARVRGLDGAAPDEIAHFVELVHRSTLMVDRWSTEHLAQRDKVAGLAADLGLVHERLHQVGLGGAQPWDALVAWAHQTLSLEGQELVVSLVLEPYGDLVDELAGSMHADEEAVFAIDGAMSVADARAQVLDAYGWATEVDWSDDRSDARVWYVSEEKLEPRLGERRSEALDDYEQPLQPGRDAIQLLADLDRFEAAEPVWSFLQAHPEHRHTVRRLQVVEHATYGEIQDNTIDATMLPIDLLRAKLSFFGATDFDPRSDRWIRITMFRGAPLPADRVVHASDTWVYPTLLSA